MCRNIRPLFNFEPPATDEECHTAALQYVRKVSGTRDPRGKNAEVFERAVVAISQITRELVDSAPAPRLISANHRADQADRSRRWTRARSCPARRTW